MSVSFNKENIFLTKRIYFTNNVADTDAPINNLLDNFLLRNRHTRIKSCKSISPDVSGFGELIDVLH